MKTLEFEAPLNPDQTLTVPPGVADQVPPGRTVRVLLMVADSDEEKGWNQLTAAEFFKGYAESDAIYDELPSG
ncbi:MAG TPA: hypothetical protein DDY78_17080 [Planctomycetales bacterium]|jgi:hypothetical protein|nr:hypothetical protein [Planctomycetales bacterium]